LSAIEIEAREGRSMSPQNPFPSPSLGHHQKISPGFLPSAYIPTVKFSRSWPGDRELWVIA